MGVGQNPKCLFQLMRRPWPRLCSQEGHVYVGARIGGRHLVAMQDQALCHTETGIATYEFGCGPDMLAQSSAADLVAALCEVVVVVTVSRLAGWQGRVRRSSRRQWTAGVYRRRPLSQATGGGGSSGDLSVTAAAAAVVVVVRIVVVVQNAGADTVVVVGRTVVPSVRSVWSEETRCFQGLVACGKEGCQARRGR